MPTNLGGTQEMDYLSTRFPLPTLMREASKQLNTPKMRNTTEYSYKTLIIKKSNNNVDSQQTANTSEQQKPGLNASKTRHGVLTPPSLCAHNGSTTYIKG